MAEHSSTTESAPGGVTRPANTPDPTDEQRMLLEFVGDRDVPCPRCGYNLRALTKPVCPECREELRLTVGRAKIRFGLLLAAMIPGVFSGICAFLLLLPIIIVPIVQGGGRTPLPLMMLDAFGWFSGLVALGLFVKRHRFLRQSETKQKMWVAGVWIVHFFAFAILVILAL